MLRFQICLLLILGYRVIALPFESELTSPLISSFLQNVNDFNATSFQDAEDLKVLEDAFLLTPELIKKYGYKAEKHTVETEDGYLLELHRIPHHGAQPILLVHGLLDSSATWVLSGPKKALGYLLSDLGYDVWLGNVRGNRYSRKHKKLNTLSSKFWKFSLDEMGKYDMPAMIDYILKQTGFKKIHYIGHSQGTILFWILCHEHPEYNNKILSMYALGPVAYLPNCRSPVVRTMVNLMDEMETLLKLAGINEFLPNDKLMTLFSQGLCSEGSVTQIVCRNIIFSMVGYDEPKLDKAMVPVITGHCPAGASTTQMLHYGQLVKSGRFCKYDFGKNQNKKIYGQSTPPSYDLSRTKVPVALFYSQNDWLTVPKDVELLRKQLPNLIGAFLASDKNYNHLDFIWAIDARTEIYEKIFDILHHVEKKII